MEEYESHVRDVSLRLRKKEVCSKDSNNVEAEQSGSYSRRGRNQMGNEPTLALPKGADDFIVYYDARSKDLETCLEKGREGDCWLTNRWLSMKKVIASCGSKYLAYLEVEVEYQGSSGFVDTNLSNEYKQDLGFIPSGNVVLSSTYVGKILGADQLLVILCYRYQESGIGYWILSMTISGSG
ncbi:hypothetical protein Tco_0826389, partial [Tanacetum coccineum]